jgi:uncharacterized protein
MEKRSLNQLEVVLKTVERCNLNCSYCYFFHSGDESYKQHPPFISAETIIDTARFLCEGCLEFGISTLIIDFHGGEPMLQSHEAFDQMCSTFKLYLSDKVNLLFTMQTNGTLVTEKWINLFAKHDVCIGVSCDGPKENHDKYRIDHKGRGSFDQMIKGLKNLQRGYQANKIQNPGLLCVINPELNGRFLYQYFRNELEITNMDFMFPNVTYETSKENPSSYGRFLCELFDAWVEEDNPKVKVRILESTLRLMLGQQSILSTSGPLIPDYETITISSAGDLGPDDALRSAHPSFLVTGKTVKNTTLKELLQHEVFETFYNATEHLPLACQSCCWQQICKGGHILHRYKHDNGFDNPSLMCSALKQFYVVVANYLLDRGLTRKRLEEVLCSKF